MLKFLTGSVEDNVVPKNTLNTATYAGSWDFVDFAPHFTTISKTPLAAIVSGFSCELRLTMAKTKQKKLKSWTKSDR